MTHPGQCIARCVCCDAGVIVPGPGVTPWIEHNADRLSGEPCPRAEWPVRDAIATDDD